MSKAIPKSALSNLGRNIRKEREVMGESQLAFAHRLGYRGEDAGAFISRVEAGKRVPRFETLLKIAKALGTTLEALLAK